MFYKPKKVTDFWTQIDKIFNVYLWSLTPLPFLIWTNNIFFLVFDWLFITDSKYKGAYPDMYANWFCQMFMSSVDNINFFGIFKYYDMFTLRGHFDWFIDFLSLITIP